MAAQPPKPPVFCVSITIDGHELSVTPDLAADLARVGLTLSSADLLNLAAELLDVDLGSLIAISLVAEDLAAPSLRHASATAAAFIQAHQVRLNERMP